MTTISDIMGQRFGRLVVTEPSSKRTKTKGAYWKCLCDCGNEVVVISANLKRGHTKSCGCLSKETRFLGNEESGLNYVVRAYKRNAELRGYGFNLTREQVREITSKDCFYCGKPPKRVGKGAKFSRDGDYTYNGIDRVDNSDGYTLENVVPCCYSCNFRKGGLSKRDMIKSLEFLGYEIIPPKLDDRV